MLGSLLLRALDLSSRWGWKQWRRWHLRERWYTFAPEAGSADRLGDGHGMQHVQKDELEGALGGDLAVTPAQARDALARVTGSAQLRPMSQLAAFLNFIVLRTLEGREKEIKGYTIAVEALGRPESFDPLIDPIVRVEAGRLRKALADYYAGPGRDDPVRIEVPRGSYVPRFVRALPELELAEKAGAMVVQPGPAHPPPVAAPPPASPPAPTPPSRSGSSPGGRAPCRRRRSSSACPWPCSS